MTLDLLHSKWVADQSEANLNNLLSAAKTAVERHLQRDMDERDRGELDDVVQRVLLKLWEGIPTFQPSSGSKTPFAGWVYLLSKYERRNKLKTRRQYDQRHAPLVDAYADGEDEDALYATEELPDDLKALLREAQMGYSLPEFCERLGLSYEATRKRVQRFRRERAA
jgi:DNA-directed RNA polymerase specialized sigma24 family protein